MSFGDMFKPYSLEQHGDLLAYVRERAKHSVDTHFFGSEPFFLLEEIGLLVPNTSLLRVDQSPAPDLVYRVNVDFLLASNGPRHYNMSAMAAEKGVYDPREVLVRQHWSAHDLDVHKIWGIE